MKYRPYMTTWIVALLLGGLWIGLNGEFTVGILMALILITLPIIIKKILLAISRIGGRNRYDEELLRVAPKGRFVNYLKRYNRKIRIIKFRENIYQKTVGVLFI